MPLPTEFNTVTLHSRWVSLSGEPYRNQKVTFAASVITGALTFTQSDTFVLPEPLTFVTDNNGEILVQLPATDDPDGSPVGFTYHVTEVFGPKREYDIALPRGGPYELTDLAPLAVSNGVAITKGDPGPAPILYATSSSSVTTTATGSRSFTLNSSADFKVGHYIRVGRVSDVTTNMSGTITAVNGLVITMLVDFRLGTSGTYSDWEIALTGQRGEPGGGVPSSALVGQLLAWNGTTAQWESPDPLRTPGTVVRRDSVASLEAHEVFSDSDPSNAAALTRRSWVEQYVSNNAPVFTPSYENAPAWSVFVVFKVGTTWTRPSTRTDISFIFRGADPAPNVVTAPATNGMYSVDMNVPTP